MAKLPIESRPGYFSNQRFMDLLAASPLVLWYLLAIGGTLLQIPSTLAHVPKGSGQWRGVLNVVVSVMNVGCFSAFVAVFFLRRLPLARAKGIMPKLVAIADAYLGLTIAFLPRVTLNSFWSVVSASLSIIGTSGTLFVLRYLGPYFSVFPQARGLVTRGPYARIRHPLYLAESTAIFGAMLSYRQPWAALIFIANFLIQLLRMSYEEEILSRTFPEYAAYRSRTYRLIPGLY